jgi:hypothetical protein
MTSISLKRTFNATAAMTAYGRILPANVMR